MKFRHLKEQRDVLSLVVAAIAVILSQFPPLYQIFDSPDLDIRTETGFGIGANAYSGISVLKYFSVTNTGEKHGRVKRIFLFIVDEKSEVVYGMSAQDYLLPERGNFGENKWNAFTELSLQPGENWSHLISFNRSVQTFDIDDMGFLREAILEEQSDWEYEMEEKGFDPDDLDENMPEFRLSDELLDQVKEEVKNKIPWFQLGNFKIVEAIITEDEVKYKVYGFSVSESKLRVFMRSIDEISYSFNLQMRNVSFLAKLLAEDVPESVKLKVKEYNNAMQPTR